MRNWLLMMLLFLVVSLDIGCSTSPKERLPVNQSTSPHIETDFNRLLVGQKVPSFRAQTLDGVTIDSMYFMHKVTLINFMYIGCAPCIEEAPMLKKLYENMKSAKFQMLCIAPQTPQQMKPLHPYVIPYAIVAECPEEDVLGHPSGLGCRSISDKFLANGYPTTLLVDKAGIIRYRHMGYSSKKPSSLKAEIKALLN